jgi:hypothetical protein
VSCFIIICWVFLKKFNINQLLKNKHKISASILISIFTLQPTIIESLLNIISCKEIDQDEFYLISYLKERCGTERHEFWTNFLFFPSFFCYVFALPAIPLIYVFRNKKNLTTKKIKRFGFLFNGYLSTKYYW